MNKVLHLPLNGDLTEKTGLAGTVSNVGATVIDEGIIGKAYNFNSDRVVVSQYDEMNSSLIDDFTIMFFAKPSTSDFGVVMEKQVDHHNTGFRIAQYGVGYLCWGFLFQTTVMGAYEDIKNTGASVDVGEWQHVAIRRTDGIISIHKNGNKIYTHDTAYSESLLNTEDLWIGMRRSTTSSFVGELGNIEFENTALSDEEIYKASKAQIIKYNFAERNTDDVIDWSSWGHNVALGVNSPSRTTEGIKGSGGLEFNATGKYLEVNTEVCPILSATFHARIRIPDGASTSTIASSTEVGVFTQRGYNPTHGNYHSRGIYITMSPFMIGFFTRDNVYDRQCAEYALPGGISDMYGNNTLTGVQNGNELKIFLNGELKATYTASSTMADFYNHFKLGAYTDVDNLWLKGGIIIDDTQVFCTALSDEEVLALHQDTIKVNSSGSSMEVVELMEYHPSSSVELSERHPLAKKEEYLVQRNGENPFLAYLDSEIVKDGLVLEYDFSAGSNSESTGTIKDLSGHGNDGTIYNLGFTDNSGWKDGDIVLDGVDDYIRLSNPFASSNGMTGFTIEMWMTPNTIDGIECFFCMRSGPASDHDSFFMFLQSGQIMVDVIDASVHSPISTVRWSTGNFPAEGNKIYVCLKSDGAKLYLYVNNFYIGEISNNHAYYLPNIASDMFISKNSLGDDYYFDTNISIIRAYDRNLTDEERTSNYNSTVKRHYDGGKVVGY